MVLGGAGEGGGEEGVRLWDEGEEEDDGDGGVGAGGVRVRKGRSWLMSGMVAGFGGWTGSCGESHWDGRPRWVAGVYLRCGEAAAGDGGDGE